jgi:dipeptidyl aminopeptidase/acylaminoacyl peptidase
MNKGMTPADLFRIQWISDARISPDGSSVAFTVTRLDQKADDYRSSIWLVDTAGGEPRRFTQADAKDSAPRWAPDGRRLAFLSDRDGGRQQVYLIDSSGGEARKLTSLPNGASAPAWSPDGRSLVVVCRTNSTEETEGPKHPPARVITSLKYRANGEGFTYDRRRHLFVVDAESGEARQLTDGDWDDIQPAWSPDGAQIAFVSARHAERDYDRAADIFVVDVTDGEPRQITPEGASVALPAWSPDGTTIAHLGYADAEDAPLNSRLWLVSSGGGAPRCLTSAYDRQLEVSDTSAPIWAPDGLSVLTGVLDRGTAGILRVEVQSGAVTILPTGPGTVTSYDRDDAGDRLAWVVSDPVRPSEVFLLENANPRRLTDLNAAWRSQTDLVEPEHVVVDSDGFAIDAWIMRPAGAETGRRYPALLNIHGGPHSQYGWSFLDEFQVQAGAGYAVIFCNPRGSAGADDAFARAIVGAPGEPDSADILRALDAALDRFDFIDRNRVGIIGGSYGGYLTSWIVGHTNRFVAACSERALNNRYSKEGTSDIWSGYTYLRKRQWEDPDLYRRFSPITYVRDIHTPVLILHSEDDLRCPIEQGEQLFVALKQLRREVRFVRFPGENHDLSRSGKPSHRIQRFEHILKWFDIHLRQHPE